MKLSKCFAVLIGVCLFSSTAFARDQIKSFSIADVLNNPEYSERLEGVRFYFGNQGHPAIVHNYGEFTSNRKTNAFNKSDKGACEWAFLSALLSLRQRALNEGGNAVVNIRGYYKKKKFSSQSEFQCGAGNIMAGVTLKGMVVKL